MAPTPRRVSPACKDRAFGALRQVARSAILGALAAVIFGGPAAADSPSTQQGTPEHSGPAAAAILEAGLALVGTPYQLGAEGPRAFDCSGLVYRIFADRGLGDFIGNTRRRAIGYYRWFAARDLTDTSAGRPGDLVVWGEGKHIGVYLGDGLALSALLSGVTVHDVDGISWAFTTFLRVDWSDSQAPVEPGADDAPVARPAPDTPDDGGRSDEDTPDLPAGIEPDATGYAVGTMNLRVGPGPDERRMGFVGRGARFAVVGTGNSPSGAAWFHVIKRSGAEGWIYSRWVRAATVDGGSPQQQPTAARWPIVRE